MGIAMVSAGLLLSRQGGLGRQVVSDAAAAQLPKRVRPRFHCFQAMARSRRLSHWPRLRTPTGFHRSRSAAPTDEIA